MLTLISPPPRALRERRGGREPFPVKFRGAPRSFGAPRREPALTISPFRACAGAAPRHSAGFGIAPGDLMLQRLWAGISRKAARHHCSKPFRMANREPLLSLTFDDVPDSAYCNGAAILQERGIRGTFYVAAGTCGTRDTDWRVIERDQVRALHAEGHEIGCHTF